MPSTVTAFSLDNETCTDDIKRQYNKCTEMCEVYIFLTAFKTVYLHSFRECEIYRDKPEVCTSDLHLGILYVFITRRFCSQSSLLSSLNEAVYTLISADNKECTEQVVGGYALSLSHTVVMLLILNHPIYNYYAKMNYIMQDTRQATWQAATLDFSGLRPFVSCADTSKLLKTSVTGALEQALNYNLLVCSYHILHIYKPNLFSRFPEHFRPVEV